VGSGTIEREKTGKAELVRAERTCVRAQSVSQTDRELSEGRKKGGSFFVRGIEKKMQKHRGQQCVHMRE